MSDVLVAAALRWTDSRAFAHPLTGTAPSAPYAAGASPPTGVRWNTRCGSPSGSAAAAWP